MKILWFTWKDRLNPLAGGAELINEGLAQKMVEAGHTVKLIVAGYKGCKKSEIINGYEVIRLGNRYTVYFLAFLYYRNHLRNWPDRVIEEVNTLPFMTQWYVKEKSRFLLVYQLCREIWFHQMIWPFSLFGYLLEPVYLYLLRKNIVLTESISTKNDLKKYGFEEEKIHVFPVFLDQSWLQLKLEHKRKSEFIILSFGSIRSMKQTHDQIRAFEMIKDKIPSARFVLAGSAQGKYGEKVLHMMKKSPYSHDMTYLGSVSEFDKRKLMTDSHVILVSSVKEGWGMIVSEAGALGTPAVVYDRDGLRDSVRNKETGFVVPPNPTDMAQAVLTLYNDSTLYATMCRTAIQYNQRFTLEKSYSIVRKNLEI